MKHNLVLKLINIPHHTLSSRGAQKAEKISPAVTIYALLNI